MKDKDRLFRKEHALYEDECLLCHPGLAPGGDAAHARPPVKSEDP
jgi:hypothetical protein